jgi:hypothetical protein
MLILEVKGLPPVSPRGDVVERAGKLDPQGSRHVQTLPQCDARNKTRLPCVHSSPGLPIFTEGNVDDQRDAGLRTSCTAGAQTGPSDAQPPF